MRWRVRDWFVSRGNTHSDMYMRTISDAYQMKLIFLPLTPSPFSPPPPPISTPSLYGPAGHMLNAELSSLVHVRYYTQQGGRGGGNTWSPPWPSPKWRNENIFSHAPELFPCTVYVYCIYKVLHIVLGQSICYLYIENVGKICDFRTGRNNSAEIRTVYTVYHLQARKVKIVSNFGTNGPIVYSLLYFSKYYNVHKPLK